MCYNSFVVFFFQAEDGIRDLVRSRGLGDVYKRQGSRAVEIGIPRPPELKVIVKQYVEDFLAR